MRKLIPGGYFSPMGAQTTLTSVAQGIYLTSSTSCPNEIYLGLGRRGKENGSIVQEGKLGTKGPLTKASKP
jgi:hypothetical protein